MNQLYNKNWLTEEEITILVDSIPKIFADNDYQLVDGRSYGATTCSLVRAECIKLARDILNKNQEHPNHDLIRMLEKARIDPLPEVRFAEMTTS